MQRAAHPSGAFKAYKCVLFPNGTRGFATLHVPAEARRSQSHRPLGPGMGRWRIDPFVAVEFADVVELSQFDGNTRTDGGTTAFSTWYPTQTTPEMHFEVGSRVFAPGYPLDTLTGGGIIVSLKRTRYADRTSSFPPGHAAPPLTMPSPPDWTGRTVVCIGSGPSLTPEDCELVRQSGHPTIAINTSFTAAPWADLLFAWDVDWWRHYSEQTADGTWTPFAGRKMSVKFKGVECIHNAEWLRRPPPNSGCAAILIAAAAGASKIVLLGFDGTKRGKVAHWHEDHPGKMTNAQGVFNWPRMFANVAKRVGVPVVNASRDTALTCFPRVELASELVLSRNHLPNRFANRGAE